MKPNREPGRRVYKLRIAFPDGRRRNCSLGTTSAQTAKLITGFVETLFAERRWDVLDAIAAGTVTLGQAYDRRTDLEGLISDLNDIDIEPLVAKWHAEKSRARKGAASADRYARQVRLLIPEGDCYSRSRFTRRAVDQHLRNLPVDDPTRNRHRAAFRSFAKYLLREEIISSNPVRDIEGWSEGTERTVYMERDEAKRVIAALEQPYQAIEALMCGTGAEWQAIEALEVRDVDLAKKTVQLNGKKTGWRRRLCRIVEEWTIQFIRPALAHKLPTARVFEGITNRRALEAHHAACKRAEASQSRLHDWRHTHAVLMLRSGYRPTVVAHQLGHRDTNLVWKRYGRFVVDERDYVLDKAGLDQIGADVHPLVPPTFKENLR